MFLRSGHSEVRGYCMGKSCEGTGRNPGLIPGNMGSSRGWTNRGRGLGTWTRKKKRQMLPAYLTAQVPPTCNCCAPISKGASSKLQTLLCGLVLPTLSAPRIPGSCSPEPSFPECCPRLRRAREGTMYHIPKKVWPRGRPHSIFSSLLASAPAFPKQQVSPSWGPT